MNFLPVTTANYAKLTPSSVSFSACFAAPFHCIGNVSAARSAKPHNIALWDVGLAPKPDGEVAHS